ncbi:DUF4352 domain-containing protein [Clostridium peptidivorans]|uniref:DUF4352 domain-containing protein n=1 Tax=Clostridium peptidivorans TaxID=100174 RepID=UPI000BE340B7|nr:DUF4352 domain-containing protein [Clostridium peptidivorans]
MNKKQTIITVVAVLVAFIVGYFVGDSSAINRVNKQVDSKIASQQDKNKEESNEEPKQEEKEEAKIYKLGEEGTSGSWNIKVLEAKETNTIVGGNSSDKVTTKEKFIVIKLQMKNLSKQAAEYSAKEFALGNMKDKTQYNITDVAFEAMGNANSKETIYNKNSNFIGVYSDINPNTTKQTYIVFEVPKDMTISDSVLINSNGGSEATGFYLSK